VELLVAVEPVPVLGLLPFVEVELMLPVASAPIEPGRSTVGDDALLETPFDAVLPIAEAVRLQLI
jgi:hypothetical protein